MPRGVYDRSKTKAQRQEDKPAKATKVQRKASKATGAVVKNVAFETVSIDHSKAGSLLLQSLAAFNQIQNPDNFIISAIGRTVARLEAVGEHIAEQFRIQTPDHTTTDHVVVKVAKKNGIRAATAPAPAPVPQVAPAPAPIPFNPPAPPQS